MSTVAKRENSSDRLNFRKETVIYKNFPEEDFYLIQEFKELEKGNVAFITCWEDVEKILEGFEDNEDFEIEELSNGIFGILPSLCVKSARKEFDKLPKAKR